MRCKVGDLAIIVNCEIGPEDIGKIVQITGYEGRRFYPDGRTAANCWLVKCAGTQMMTTGGLSAIAIMPDECLRPIRPEPEMQPAPPQTVEAV